jgi:hypothetical protein
MRPAIGPDLPPLLHPLDVRVDLHHRIAGRVVVVGDAQVADAAESIGGGVRLAGVLLHREDAGVPGLAAQPAGVVDGKTEVIADLRARCALDLVLVHDRRPDTGEVDLRGRRSNRDNPHENGAGNQPNKLSLIFPQSCRLAGSFSWRAPRAWDRYADNREDSIHATSRNAGPSDGVTHTHLESLCSRPVRGRRRRRISEI